MESSIMENLIASGDIRSYSWQTLNENEEVVERVTGGRNTEKLTITFPSGKTIAFHTFCSGSSENTSIFARYE